jgi:pantoate--beta-alanine ligase
MQQFYAISETQHFIDKVRKSGRTIGFVPTMGALHEGHLQLMRRAKEENDLLACSIFVNPIQFNNPEDLEKYPRTLEEDKKKLSEVGCDILFSPSVDEMYPEEVTRRYDFGALDKVMEGKFRPGHFNGVAVVVDKLFRIVKPHTAYFGEKDFQQLAIIRKMTEMEGHDIAIVPCPIAREEDGLAMSSRNARLSNSEREKAPFIYKMLLHTKELSLTQGPAEVQKIITDLFEKQAGFRLEYFEIADTSNLQTVRSWNEASGIIACVAAFLGPVRLIDNLILFHNFAPA